MSDILVSYINSLRPILYIKDQDLVAVDKRIKAISSGFRVVEYSNAYGTIDFETKRPINISMCEASLASFLALYKDAAFDSPHFFVLKDVHHELDNPVVIAQMRHIAERTMNTPGYSATIFLVSKVQKIPREIEHLVTLVPGMPPKQRHIEKMIRNYSESQGFCISEEDIGALALELKGLPEFQIGQILNSAYCNGGTVSFNKDRPIILDEKKQLVEKSGLLEFVTGDHSLEQIGGLETLKHWIRKKADIFRDLDRALKFGVDRPKGVLILGLPGCGKSLTAKTTASIFKTPLVRLDIGRLLGKYIGESEANMRDALALAESISPCVLWIDEIEKAFAGGDAGNTHEVTLRLVGHFLTWMQEKENTVFVVATANNIKNLPPEFLRKGRFDEVFSVVLPDKDERREIVRIHLEKRNRWHSGIDTSLVASKTDLFSGADLESLISMAVESAFLSKSKQVETSHLLDAVEKTMPLAKLLKEEIDIQKEKLSKYAAVEANKKIDWIATECADNCAPHECIIHQDQFGMPFSNYYLFKETTSFTSVPVREKAAKEMLVQVLKAHETKKRNAASLYCKVILNGLKPSVIGGGK